MDQRALTINREVLKQAVAKKLYIPYDNINLISESETYIFTCQYKKNSFIIRLFDCEHRTKNEIIGEIEWIEYLYSKGISLARVICLKKNNDIVIPIEVMGISFYIVVFEHASGCKVFDIHKNENTTFIVNNDFFCDWGEMLGKLHSTTKKFLPIDSQNRRKKWNETIPSFHNKENISKYILVNKHLKEIVAYIKSLNINNDSYGLIHCDVTFDNFFVNDKKITLFDFDNCKYHFFVYDFAVILDAVRQLPHKDISEKYFISDFLYHFLDGYKKENSISLYWLKQISYFLKLWRLENFIQIINKVNFNDLKEWEKRVINRLQTNIEEDKDYFSFDIF